MARLTSLSTELLLDLLRYIPAEDLESTSESSRLLRCVTQPLLDEHRKRLEEQYEEFIPPIDYDTFDPGRWNDSCKYDDFNGWFIGLLCTVITDQRIGKFAKELVIIWDLAGNEGGWDASRTFPGALPGFTKARRQLKGSNSRTFRQICEQALRQSMLLSQDEKHHWLEGFPNSNQMPAIALLLEELSALESIRIKVKYKENLFDLFEYDQLLKCLERAAAESRSPSPVESPISLPCQNLTCVVLEFDSENAHHPGAGLVPDPSSIVELRFMNTSMDLTALSELLRNLPNPKHFTYGHEQEEDMYGGVEWLIRGPLNVIPTLGRSAGHCLETLRMLQARRVVRLLPGTFKAFTPLRRLEIDLIVLHDREDWSQLGGVAGILPSCLEELDLFWDGRPPIKDVQTLREYLLTLIARGRGRASSVAKDLDL